MLKNREAVFLTAGIFMLFGFLLGLWPNTRTIETTVTQTCPEEKYTLFSKTGWSLSTATVLVVAVEDELWLGKRCLNCGGIHRPEKP